MERTQLGKSGPKVSRIGLGAMQASGAQGGWPYNEDEIFDAVKRSRELGVNFIDTAEEYGQGESERVIGKALRKFGRDNFVVATKVYGQHLRYEELQKACTASMERLGVDEIDLYQVHWPDPWEQIPMKYTMRALEKLHSEGKIGAIGVSNFAVRDLEEARSLLSHAEIVSNQVRYNILQREIEEEVLPYCQKNSISIIAWSPIAQGALTGKYGKNQLPADYRASKSPMFSEQNLGSIGQVNAVLAGIAQSHGKTISQVALNWLLSTSRDVVPIPGARNGRQAEENAMAAGWKLENSELSQIAIVLSKTKIDYFP